MNVSEKKEMDSIKDTLAGIIARLDKLNVLQTRPTLVLKKEDRINYILDSVSDFYGEQREVLLKRYKNTKYANRKKLIIKLLRDIADVTYADIADAIGGSQESICMPYLEITEILNESTYGNKELKQEYKELLKYIGV